jgi:hypothetical protein
MPASLKIFVDHFLREDGRYDKKLLIWTSAENSSVLVIVIGVTDVLTDLLKSIETIG